MSYPEGRSEATREVIRRAGAKRPGKGAPIKMSR